MADIPGLADLLPKILGQCGLVAAVFAFGCVWFAVQLAKERADREKERADMLKMYVSQGTALEKVNVSNARLEVAILAIRGHAGDDD